MTTLAAYGQLMIDPDGPVPYYRQLADMLREQIVRGDLPPGRAIPSASRLVQEYGVARGTALRAIRVLVEEGLCFVVPGKGTYVKAPQPDGRRPGPTPCGPVSR